jgi:hypothetical protein
MSERTWSPQVMVASPLRPEVLIGAASPLWSYFTGAALSGMAMWWTTRWMQPATLLKAAPAPLLAAPTEAVAEAVALVEAAIAPVLEAPVEAVAEIAAPVEPVLEARAEAVPDIAAAVEPVLETPVEAVAEVAAVAEPVIEAAAEPVVEMFTAAEPVVEAPVEVVAEAPVSDEPAELPLGGESAAVAPLPIAVQPQLLEAPEDAPAPPKKSPPPAARARKARDAEPKSKPH